VPAARLLLNDASPAVRSLMTRNLGPLIASVGEKCDAVMVSKFTSALSSPDLSLCFAAAYAFPAVALALGRRRFPELLGGFEAVVVAPEFRVRRTIAFGLFEYAAIVPQKELVESVVTFLKDLPTVAIGIYAHFDRILPALPNPGEFIAFLRDAQAQPDWRLRLEISAQIRQCGAFFDRAILLGIAKGLAVDPVWKVRKDAAVSVAAFLSDEDLPFLFSLATGGNVVERIAAAGVIENLRPALVHEPVVEWLNALVNDKVANVRAAAARAVAAHARDVPALRELRMTLRRDTDPDVRD
jgi:hypothetical protein